MYLSPEMILRAGHNYMVDIYSLGVLIYELVAGFAPFYIHDDRNKIRAEILYSKIPFPKKFSKELKNLLKKMLVKNPEERICYDGSILDLLTERWFVEENNDNSVFRPEISSQQYQEFNVDVKQVEGFYSDDLNNEVGLDKNFFGFYYNYSESEDSTGVCILKSTRQNSSIKVLLTDEFDEGFTGINKTYLSRTVTMKLVQANNIVMPKKKEKKKKGFFSFLF